LGWSDLLPRHRLRILGCAKMEKARAGFLDMKPGLWISEALRPLDAVTRPHFALPADAVDCHMHIFGPADSYPGSPDARYTLPEGSAKQYQALADVLGLGKTVLVQPSYYGTDNACLLDAMARFDRPCCGVVFLPDKPEASLIKKFQQQGVCGIRLDFFKALPDDAPRLLMEAATIAEDAGWHIELYSPGRVVSRLLDRLAALSVDFSVNHLGYMKRDDGADDTDFSRFLDLARTPHCWVKLTGPYRIDPDSARARTDAMARALIAAAPERVVWGTDWPHLPHGSRDTGELLNRLGEWCPEENLRNQILAHNPLRLYRFNQGGRR
jgi:predicted TIM-barrel fold metal-dependent hydrolase